MKGDEPTANDSEEHGKLTAFRGIKLTSCAVRTPVTSTSTTGQFEDGGLSQFPSLCVRELASGDAEMRLAIGVSRDRFRRFPERHFTHRKPLRFREVEDQPGDRFRRRILGKQIQRLTLLLEK